MTGKTALHRALSTKMGISVDAGGEKRGLSTKMGISVDAGGEKRCLSTKRAVLCAGSFKKDYKF